MVRIKWTKQSKEDLKSVADYISIDSVKYAKLQVVRIRTRTSILKNHLHAGKITPELNDPDIRELIEGNYRIIYRILSENHIDILTIHHSARDLSGRSL